LLAACLTLVTGLSGRGEPAVGPVQKNAKQVRTDRYGDPLPPGAVARLGTVRFRHGEPVSALAFLPGGGRLVSGGADGTVRLWEVSTGRELRRFLGHEGGVAALAVSAEGKRLISGGADKALHVWDVSTGRKLHRLRGHEDEIRWVALTADGRKAASAGTDTTFRLWDLLGGKELRRLSCHRDCWVRAVAFSPDGKALASACTDRAIRLWRPETGPVLRTINTRVGTHCLAFSPDGKTLVSAGISLPPEGKSVISAAQYGVICFWDTATGKELRRLPEQPWPVLTVKFSPAGDYLASGGWMV
jgi:WD40 repeat protein